MLKLKKTIAAISAIVLLTSCGVPETAEVIATTATATTASQMPTATETTTAKTTTATTSITNETENAKTEKQPEIRELIIDGSTSTIPLHAYIISKQSGENYGNVRYYTEHSKTFEAFDNLIAGEADVILTVPITPEQRTVAENTEGFTLGETAIALEGFVFIVNPENPVKSLTQAQIRDIYSGKITNWKEVGGDDAEITAYQRNETSGSQSYMNEFMGETPLSPAPKTMIINEMGDMMQTVADYTNGKYALGYSVYSYAAGEQVSAGNVALLAVDGIKPDRESFTAKTYPLLSNTMLYYNKSNKFAVNFRDMMISDEGQLIVLEAGYLPVREIEIPDIYAIYNELGTGKEKPADKGRPTEYSYYQGNFYSDYIDFLADKEFEAVVNEWIKSNMSDKNGYCNQEIYNGYLSVETGYRAAVWDLYTGKKIEKFNELFYKDVPMYPIVDAATLVAADSDISGWSFLRCDYFGFLGKTEDFSAALFTLPNENAYFTTSIKVPLLLCLEDNSIVSEYRDSQRFLVDGEEQEIIKIPPYDRADFEIEVDGRSYYYYQIKWDEKPADEVARINAGLIKACDYWRENLDYRKFSGRNELSYDWDFELTEDSIRFYVQDGEMLFDFDGNFITSTATPPTTG
jgi:phosphate transport system substrate-binding protein